MKNRAPRVKTSITIEVTSKSTGLVVRGTMLNISENGMFLYVDSKLPPKDEVVSFVLNSSNDAEDVIVGHGIVRWNDVTGKSQDFPGFGIEFREISQSALKRLKEMFESFRAQQRQKAA